MTGEARVQISTEQEPYHYIGSGLTNVYLVGVEYTCVGDSMQADIPGLPNLLEAIGDAIAGKNSRLRGEEVRFLRKRLRIAAKDFAAAIGMTPEHYSRIENGSKDLPQSVELNARFTYAAYRSLAGLSKQIAEQRLHVVEPKTPTWSAGFANQRIIACRDESGHWRVESLAA